MVLRHGALLAGIGVAAGLLFAALLARLARSQWFGIAVNDPLVFAVVPVMLAAVALLAAWLPARRATRVDPVVALRME
jgi:ABC-type antimicrobial peptide transport system permease subunit